MKSSAIRWIRDCTRRAGFDVVRYPISHPDFYIKRLLDRLEIDTVIDVGANRGQFAGNLLECGYRGRVMSLEPVEECFSQLFQRTVDYSTWQAYHLAAGRETTLRSINVASNGGASSSFLHFDSAHENAAPEVRYLRQEMVQQIALDSMLGSDIAEDSRTFLKIDVQGAELDVLEGAIRLLQTTSAVHIELSLASVYVGGVPAEAIKNHLEEAGFSLIQLTPIFWSDRNTVLQADGVFLRHDASPATPSQGCDE